MPNGIHCLEKNDILTFNIEIKHEFYKNILMDCSVHNFLIFGTNGEIYYPSSGAPDIFHSGYAVEMIICIKNKHEYNKTIIASPLIITDNQNE